MHASIRMFTVVVFGLSLGLGCSDSAPPSLPNGANDGGSDGFSGSRDGFIGDGMASPDGAMDAGTDPDQTVEPVDAGPDAAVEVDAELEPDAEIEDMAVVDAAIPDMAEPDAEPCVDDCDDDGFSIEEGDCADDDPDVFPGAVEACDGIDNNCDMVVDGMARQCYDGDENTLGVGLCQPGQSVCTDGEYGPCMEQVQPTDEVCGDGVDDNCDGVADDGCDEDMDGFEINEGDCRDDLREVNPDAEEVCDGIDNDCDNTVDGMEEACYAGPDGTQDIGICRGGISTCVAGAFGDCAGQVLPANDEACGNETDEDCDGNVDEGCAVDGCPDVDLDVQVNVSSSCLTAGSGAMALVSVTLIDGSGEAVENADVQIGVQPEADLGEPIQSGNRYGRVIDAPGAPGDLTFSATIGCNDGTRLALRDTATITVAPALEDGLTLATGGCEILDGNVQVKVIDGATGGALSGAWVMAGLEDVSILQTDAEESLAGNAGDGRVVVRTDEEGMVRIADFGDTLRGPLTITVGAEGYENVSLMNLDAGSIIVPIFSTEIPADPRADIGGTLSEFNDLGRDDFADMGLVLGSFDMAFLSTLALPKLLSRSDCWDPVSRGLVGNLVPEITMPGNICVPEQAERALGFPATIERHNFNILNMRQGADNIVALSGKVPVGDIVNLLLAGSPDLSDVIGLLSPTEMGVLRNHNVNGDQNNLNISLTTTLNNNASCRVSNTPGDTGVVCVSAGDWSGNDGTGRLFPMGLVSAQAQAIRDAGGNGLELPLTTAPSQGLFQNIGYLGAAIALFLSADDAPDGEAGAVSAVLDRTTLGANGGQMVLDSFFDTTPIVREGPQIVWNPVATDDSPAVDACRVEIVRRLYTRYNPGRCSEDRVDTEDIPAWRMYAAGDPGRVIMPDLPEEWPNGGNNGLINPGRTAELDSLEVRVSCFGLDVVDPFNFNGADFSVLVDRLTHVSSNSVRY